jgi:hypothetical protein
MEKRGQITIFIVLGLVVLLITFLLSVIAQNTVLSIIQPNELNIASLTNFITSCVETTTEQGVYFVSLRGGYYETLEPYILYENVKVPYYWHQEQTLMPSKEMIQNEIESYVRDNIPRCIHNFNVFRNLGYEFNEKEIEIEIVMRGSAIIINVEYPILISRKESTTELNSLRTSIQIALEEKYSLVTEFMDQQRKNNNSIPLGFLADLSHSNDFTFEEIYLGDGTVIYLLVFKEHRSEPLIYAFAAKYNWEDVNI